MFRHSIKQSTRMGALSHSAAFSMAGSALNANWKGVQSHDYQHLEAQNIGNYWGEYLRPQEVDVRRGAAWSQQEPDGNLSYPYRKTSVERRPCNCQAVAADGSSAMQSWPWRGIYRGLVPPSLSPAGAGRTRPHQRPDIVTLETTVSRIAGRFSGRSPGAQLSHRIAARLARSMPRLWAEEPIFTLGPVRIGSVRPNRFRASTEKWCISEVCTGHNSDAHGIAGENKISADVRCRSTGSRPISLYGELT